MKRSTYAVPALTAALLVAFYVGVWLLPRVARKIAARSLYNYYETARRAVERGEYDRAVEVLERAARKIPRDLYFERPEYMYDWIGRIRRKQKRPELSLEAFLLAQKHYFRNVRLRGYLPPPRLVCDIIEDYFATGNPAGAYNEARIALDFYPMLADRFLRSHMRHAPKEAIAMRDLGRLEIKLKRLAVARDHLRASLKLDPALAESHYLLGRLAEVALSTASAVVEYEKELENNPFAFEAARRLFRLYAKMGRDPSEQKRRLAAVRKRSLVVEFRPSNPSKPLASLWGVGARFGKRFELAEPAPVLISIAARSTPCYELFGWIEIRLDGRHLQTLYLDEPFGDSGAKYYALRPGRLDSGPHVLTIENLSDATDGTSDRNVFIHDIRIFRLDKAS